MLPEVERLHRALALGIVVTKRSRLTAAEVRFLRTYLGWSGEALATRMGLTPETASRWEGADTPAGPVADRLLRLMATTHARASTHDLDASPGSGTTRPRFDPAPNEHEVAGSQAEPAATERPSRSLDLLLMLDFGP